jgi:hypothetical protein
MVGRRRHERAEGAPAPGTGGAVAQEDRVQAIGAGELGHYPMVRRARRSASGQAPDATKGQAADLWLTWPFVCGGRYWVRTSDLFGVNEALYH